MGFLSKLNKSLGFSKGRKQRMREAKRRAALRPKYVENPMGRILSPSGRFNQSAFDRRIAEMTALNPEGPKRIPPPPMDLDRMISLPERPKRGGGFLGKIKNKAFDKIESGKIPARRGFLRGQYFGPRGNMGMPSMPNFGMPRMPQPIPKQMPTDPSSY